MGSTQHVLQKGYDQFSLAFRFAGFKKEEGYYQLAWYKADGNTSTEGVYSALEPEDVVLPEEWTRNIREALFRKSLGKDLP